MGRKKKKGTKSDIGGGSAYGEYVPKDWERPIPPTPKAKLNKIKPHDQSVNA